MRFVQESPNTELAFVSPRSSYFLVNDLPGNKLLQTGNPTLNLGSRDGEKQF